MRIDCCILVAMSNKPPIENGPEQEDPPKAPDGHSDAAHAAPREQPGMGGSVAPHAQITEHPDYTLLLCGYDSLDLSFRVDWGVSLLEWQLQLDYLVEKCRNKEESI